MILPRFGDYGEFYFLLLDYLFSDFSHLTYTISVI